MNEPDEQIFKIENETSLLDNKAARTRAKKNFKNRLNELDQKINEDKDDIEETKFIISPRLTSDGDEQLDKTKTIKLKKKRGTAKKSENDLENKLTSQARVNLAYESNEDLNKDEKEVKEKNSEEKPRKRTRKARKKEVESNLKGLLSSILIYIQC